MKNPILASIFCLAFVFALHAQEKQPAAPKLTSPFLSPPPNIGVWPALKGKQHPLLVPPNAFTQPLKLTGKFPAAADTGLCSVPLLEAHVDAADPGITITLHDHSVPIPQARVPAPSCKE
jgi:hypothetical protein